VLSIETCYSRDPILPTNSAHKNLTNDFEDLNDDWDFISQSATKVELIDVSGGNGGTDYLTFEKN